ncbi:MAG: hypothetical protein M3464_10445 [Chloroflexota bacterium]|nr:hypothetical protein [Chloroflexota bacterium]
MRPLSNNRLLALIASVMPSAARIRWVVLLAVTLAVLPFAAFAFFQLAPNAPSPATGQAQVVAHGVSPLPGRTLAWRIVHDTAEPREQAVAEERALGFALADHQAILVSDQQFGSQQRLAAGEASFVAGGTLQQRASLTNEPAPYFRLALVAAEQATEAGGDRLVFAGDAWTAPAGEQFDLDLIRNVVAPNEAASIPAANGLTAVLATDGTIEVEAGADLPVRLEAGQAANFTGELAIYGVGLEPATYVAAVVGPEVPAPPAPPTGSITINVLGCPAGLTAADVVAGGFAPDAIGGCQPTALAADPLLILAGNQPLAPDQPAPEQGSYTWNLLLYSPFPVADFELPAGYDSYLLVNPAGIVKASDGAGVTPSVPDPDVLFVDGQAPNPVATLFLFAGDAGGSISLAPFTCPEGMTIENFDSSFCEAPSGSFDIDISSLASGQRLTIADASTGRGSPFYSWTALPEGDYAIDVTALPVTHTDFTIPGLDLDPATGSYAVALTAAIPDAQYNLFFLQEGDSGASGTITVTVLNCPPGMGRDTLDPAACQPATGFDLNLYPPTGGVLGLSDASVQANTVTWNDVPFAEYGIEEIVLPAGYTDAYAPDAPTSSLSERVSVVAVSAASPSQGLTIYNLLVPAGTPDLTSDVDD